MAKSPCCSIMSNRETCLVLGILFILTVNGILYMDGNVLLVVVAQIII